MISTKLRRLGRHLVNVTPSVYAYLAFARGLVRFRDQIVQIWPDTAIDLGENVAIFIHFDKRGQLADHVLAYVQALKACGFDIVFVTNSGPRFRGNQACLQTLCRAVVVRRNVGYDFGAIREVMDRLDLPRDNTQRLIIANDSVYAPLSSLSDMLGKIDFDAADLWGATDSWQHRYHLQSYFLVAGRRAITSPAWKAFWQNVRQVSSKRWTIVCYEVGLTQAFLKAGLRCRALWPYHSILDHVMRHVRATNSDDVDPCDQKRMLTTQRIARAAANLDPLNPTAELWRHLLESGFPFLKVELLRKNPSRVPDIGDWRSVLATLPAADIEVIERDLFLKARNRAP